MEKTPDELTVDIYLEVRDHVESFIESHAKSDESYSVAVNASISALMCLVSKMTVGNNLIRGQVMDAFNQTMDRAKLYLGDRDHHAAGLQ